MRYKTFVKYCALFLALLIVPSATMAQQSRSSKPAPSQTAGPKYLNEIKKQSDFDLLKRIYYRGSFAAIPHLMFVIDREQDKTYYVNSKRYAFHSDFVNANYLSLERGAAFFQKNYSQDNRRFVLGTLAFQPAKGQYTFEFWEGDKLSSDLLTLTYRKLHDSFFAPIAFKPNSLNQEQASNGLNDIPRLLAADLEPEHTYEAVNYGETIGILRLIEEQPPERQIERDDIVIFKQIPVSLTPISGVITARPGSPLSHINMLCRGWGIPDVFIKDADIKYKDLIGRMVRLKANAQGVSLEPVDYQQVQSYMAQREHAQLKAPRADLDWKSLTDLKDQRSKDVVRFGAKAANLGEVYHARIPNVIVPDGFSIPFYYYAQFAKSINLEDRVVDFLNDDKFHHQAAVRQKKLAELRDFMQHSQLDDNLRRAVLEKVHRDYAGEGLFIRSSTNSEDLPNFNGAGLYTTVPNARTDEAIIEGVKTVWASIWNFEAYEAREAARIDHLSVYAGVLVQKGINADSAGVLITTNPFDKQDHRGVYINAKKGLGIKVVEGQKVAEQIIYRPQTNAVRVLTRSAEDSLLTFDEKGGVKEVQTFPNRAVLTDAVARKLSRAALAIKRTFGGRDQDIEWVIVKDDVYIVQSRPYLD